MESIFSFDFPNDSVMKKINQYISLLSPIPQPVGFWQKIKYKRFFKGYKIASKEDILLEVEKWLYHSLVYYILCLEYEDFCIFKDYRILQYEVEGSKYIGLAINARLHPYEGCGNILYGINIYKIDENNFYFEPVDFRPWNDADLFSKTMIEIKKRISQGNFSTPFK